MENQKDVDAYKNFFDANRIPRSYAQTKNQDKSNDKKEETKSEKNKQQAKTPAKPDAAKGKDKAAARGARKEKPNKDAPKVAARLTGKPVSSA